MAFSYFLSRLGSSLGSYHMLSRPPPNKHMNQLPGMDKGLASNDQQWSLQGLRVYQRSWACAGWNMASSEASMNSILALIYGVDFIPLMII